jgi:acetolactate synthase-1/2/3 large subunit
VFYVFSDGELSQISQTQAIPYNRKTCSVLPEIRLRGIADAVGAAFFEMKGDADIERVIAEAEASAAKGQPVVVDVRIDYSKATRFTQGIVKTTLGRMTMGNKLRMLGRAAWRRIRTPE